MKFNSFCVSYCKSLGLNFILAIYFHYYKLRLDCSNPLTILNNLQLATYWTSGIPAVKSDITIGNGVSPISLNSGVCYVFRAVNSITINGDFSAPIGSELNIIPTPCN